MSINIKKWVDIATTTTADTATDRELILRIITKNSNTNWVPSDPTQGRLAECTTMSEIEALFGSSSAEYKVAECYLSYVSLTATKPTKISFYYPPQTAVTTTSESGETTTSYYDRPIASVLNAMEQESDNFATFFFMTRTDYNENTHDRNSSGNETSEYVFENAAAWAKEKNYKFRFVVPVLLGEIASQTGPLSWTKLSTADDYIGKYAGKECVTMVLDDASSNDGTSTYPEWMTCAMLAATRYSRSNSTIIQEFKSDDNMNVTCKDETLYDILTALNVNFYGQTMKAGKTIEFYMEGYNADGTDTAVCDNEIWLKDRITSEAFNRFLTSAKVPAGAVGRAMVKSAIVSVISEGLNNLAIQPEKTISDSDKAAIIQNTGATDAPALIYTNGYYLDVADGDDETAGNGTRRVVNYILYYSTGEGIRKVTGSNVLV